MKLPVLPLSALLASLAATTIALAQSVPEKSTPPTDPASPATTAPRLLKGDMFLKKTDGHWVASLTGDLADPNTELVHVSPDTGAAEVLVQRRKEGFKACMTKMKDRGAYGYIDCNSAFFAAEVGGAATLALVRGVMSLGILTATDAASGSTQYFVSPDPSVLTTALAEAKAIEFARENAQLLEYRSDLATNSASPSDLRRVIAKYEGIYDPESLVAAVKERLNVAIAAEAENARRAAAQQQEEERQRQARAQALARFQGQIKAGDRVKLEFERMYQPAYALVVEVRQPLAYVQFENVTPPMRWVRVDTLLPPE